MCAALTKLKHLSLVDVSQITYHSSKAARLSRSQVDAIHSSRLARKHNCLIMCQQVGHTCADQHLPALLAKPEAASSAVLRPTAHHSRVIRPSHRRNSQAVVPVKPEPQASTCKAFTAQANWERHSHEAELLQLRYHISWMYPEAPKSIMLSPTAHHSRDNSRLIRRHGIITHQVQVNTKAYVPVKQPAEDHPAVDRPLWSMLPSIPPR